MEVNPLKRIGLRFLALLSVFFVGNLILNVIFKPDVDVGTAFLVSFGASTGVALVEYYLLRKKRKGDD